MISRLFAERVPFSQICRELNCASLLSKFANGRWELSEILTKYRDPHSLWTTRYLADGTIVTRRKQWRGPVALSNGWLLRPRWKRSDLFYCSICMIVHWTPEYTITRLQLPSIQSIRHCAWSIFSLFEDAFWLLIILVHYHSLSDDSSTNMRKDNCLSDATSSSHDYRNDWWDS